MAIVVFELSMPQINTWNGHWSGENNYYAVTRSLPKSEASQLNSGYRYDFGDGWVAQVNTRIVDSAAAKIVRRRSRGFCGYEWMIDSILKHGAIRSSDAA